MKLILPQGVVDCSGKVVHLDKVQDHGGERELTDINLCVWHDTAGDSARSSIAYLNSDEKVGSYHYLIDRNGDILRMCPITTVAYACGVSAWPTPAGVQIKEKPPGHGPSVNHRSVSVAFANHGDDKEQLTPEQVNSGVWLGLYLSMWLNLTYAQHVGHREVAPIRKVDPPVHIFDMDGWRKTLAVLLRTTRVA